MQRYIVVWFVVACTGPIDREDPDVRDAGTSPPTGESGEDEPSEWTSGSRIKARVTVTSTKTADGAMRSEKYFGGWYDAMRDEVCSPSIAADGKTRCLPQASRTSTNYFADAACTVPAVMVYDCSAAAPKYLAVYAEAGATCTTNTAGPQLFTVGAKQSIYYSKGTACNGPTNAGATIAIYPVATPVPASSFAEMTVTTTTE